jgi:hypothetical protein
LIMELDDLKQSWKQNNTKQTTNTDIMELIQHKSYGPIAALKREFKRQMRIFVFIPALLIMTNAKDFPAVLYSVLFWAYIVFCLGVIVFSFYNYRIVEKMENMDGMVRTNLQKQVDLLETRLNWNQIGIRIALLVFIALTEILPYFQHYRMLDKWHSLNPFIRFGSYAALLLLQYFIGRWNCDRKFGAHIRHLKTLIKEMQ